MTWHIVGLAGAHDKYKPSLQAGDDTLVVPFDIPGHPDSVQNHVRDVLAKHELVLSEAAHDFLNAAMAAYTADVRVPRKKAFDTWTRDIILHLPVSTPSAWAEGAETLKRLLSFLTGDHWRVEVRQAPKSFAFTPAKTPRKVLPLNTKTVCLFSGGLDSYIGAVDQLEKVGQVALVGHHSSGGGPTSRSQTLALGVLRKGYAEDLTPFLQFWVSPPKGSERVSETTTRGRSIMFLGLGVAVANGLSAERLIVPENGVISLNVPLTDSRLGSFSTRTTHPHLMRLVRQLLANLGINVEVQLPYRFHTKGEMLKDCANQGMVKLGLTATMSCSHPGASRFTVGDPNIHCGYCVPCIIRRAAVRASGKRDPTDYAFVDLSQPLSPQRGSDLRALRLALDRYESERPTLANLLVAGPLPGSDDDLGKYLGVFRRGIDEIRKFLLKYK